MNAAARPARALAAVASRRAKFVFYLAFAIALGLCVRLYIVQVRDGASLSHQAYEQRLSTIRVAAHRGTIYDRDGNELVTSIPGQSVYATVADVTDAAGEARRLAPALGDETATQVEQALRTKGGYVQIDHKVDRNVAAAVAKLALPGISVVPEMSGTRLVPGGRMAGSVLGFTGFDENGLDGIEYQYDFLLRGTPGREDLETDENGRSIPFAQPHVIEASHPGYSLVLTIDSYLQYNVERVLRSTIAQWHAESGSAIVMDPNTGEVLAIANMPDFDPRAGGDAPADARRDRAVMDAYEPGSTFKLITAAAALDSGLVTASDRFAALDRLQIGDDTIHNAEDGFLAGSSGTETLEDIIAYSHNVGAAEVGLRIGRKTMFEALRRFGFGTSTNLGLPGENPGIVPRLSDWSETTLPTVSFGHGISTTPIALARAYCAIANGGWLVRPRILSAILDADGRVKYRYGREIERRAITAKTAAILRGYLRAVVLRGTGNPTAKIEGYSTAGKTGTAQVAENGFYAAGQYVASFIGYVPAESPRYVILVKVAKPHGAIYGSVIAAPAFAQIARMAMMHAGVMPAGPRLVRRPESAKSRT